MKRISTLLLVAATFCCFQANAQRSFVGAANSSGKVILLDSIVWDVPGGFQNYDLGWYYVFANVGENATDLAAGDTIFGSIALNGHEVELQFATNGVKKDSGTYVSLKGLGWPREYFKSGDYANVVVSKVLKLYTGGAYKEIDDQNPHTGHFTVNFTEVGIANTELEQVRVYPNPVRNSLNIENANNLQVNIYAANGQLVKNVTVNGNTTISVSDLSAGLYIMKMQGEKATRVEKIQVVR